MIDMVSYKTRFGYIPIEMITVTLTFSQVNFVSYLVLLDTTWSRHTQKNGTSCNVTDGVCHWPTHLYLSVLVYSTSSKHFQSSNRLIVNFVKATSIKHQEITLRHIHWKLKSTAIIIGYLQLSNCSIHLPINTHTNVRFYICRTPWAAG